MTCASTSSSGSYELTVLARVGSGGDPLEQDAQISMVAGEQTVAFAVAAGSSHGLATFTNPVPLGATLTATATSAGMSAHASCTVMPGLAEVNPAARAIQGGAHVIWPSVQGAARYHVAALDFATHEVLAATTATSSPETLVFETPTDHVVVIDFIADALPTLEAPLPASLPAPRRTHRQVLLTAGPAGGSGATWQLFGPGDFVNGTLQIRYPELGSEERVAVILSNAGGLDLGSTATPAALIEVSGTSEPAMPEEQVATLSAPHDRPPRVLSDSPSRAHGPSRTRVLHTLAMHRRDAPSTLPPALGDHQGLCVTDWSDATLDGFKRIFATVQHRSAHAAFWVDDRAQAAFDAARADGRPNLWHDLEVMYEAQILPALRTHFGMESDETMKHMTLVHSAGGGTGFFAFARQLP